MGDSFNKGVIEHDKSSNIVDSHNNHEQPRSQLTKQAFRHSNFYKSHDRGNMINRNLEHHNQVFHTGQLKKEDIAQKGLLLLQIHTKTTFQPQVT